MSNLPSFTPKDFHFYPSEEDFLQISREWNLIKEYYGDRRANRSRVPLINHIVEGLSILNCIGASTQAKAAFCVHPLVQADEDLVKNFDLVRATLSSDIMALAMEYRSTANAYLSKRTIYSLSEIKLSPLKDVNDMLIADKVQNYKDFILYHYGTHPRSAELREYFENWLEVLDCNSVMNLYWRLYGQN